MDNEFVMSQNYKKIIVPSEWVKDLYNKWIPSEKIIVWPVGIDTDYFSDKSKDDKFFDCLIYYKRRSYDELNFVKNLLREFNQNFDIVEYGSYSEIGFLEKLSRSRYVFVLDSCESQGIAIQEIMSSNIPLFVWDMEFWEDRGREYKIEATSVPFWDDVCGIKEKNKDFVFIEQRLDYKNMIQFNKPNSDKKYSKKDFRDLKAALNVDEVMYINVKYGLLVSYYGLIELEKDGYVNVVTETVDLSDNSLLQQDNFQTVAKMDGNWKKGEDYENLRNAIQGAINNAATAIRTRF
jgi:hypothetical protein